VDNLRLMVDGSGGAPPAPVKGSAKPGDTFPNEPTITASDALNAAKLGPLGYVASPLTAWTTGQHITVNGFNFYWNGTAWTAGSAALAEFSLTSIDPNSVEEGCQDDLLVTIYGTGFTDGLQAALSGTDLETEFVSDTELHVVVPAALLTTVGNKQLHIGPSYKVFKVLAR
jgi:hypothetical protein